MSIARCHPARPGTILGRALGHADTRELSPAPPASAPPGAAPASAAAEGPSRPQARVGDISTHIAHEVRNGLSAIRALAQMAVGTGDLTRKDELLHRIVRSVDTLGQALEQILLAARSPRAAHEPVDPAALLRAMVEEFEGLIQAAGVEVRVWAQPGTSWVYGDRAMVRQALGNIVRNALEAMAADLSPPPGKRHRLELGCRPQSLTPATVLLWVKDTGPGIAPECRDRLFTAPVSAGKETGTGIGLIIAHQIVVDGHGGRIWFDTTPEGTVFFVELPSADQRRHPG